MKVFGNINIRRSVGDHPLHPRALTLKGGCCDVDKCNSHDPENEPTEPPGYVRTTIPNGNYLIKLYKGNSSIPLFKSHKSIEGKEIWVTN